MKTERYLDFFIRLLHHNVKHNRIATLWVDPPYIALRMRTLLSLQSIDHEELVNSQVALSEPVTLESLLARLELFGFKTVAGNTLPRPSTPHIPVKEYEYYRINASLGEGDLPNRLH